MHIEKIHKMLECLTDKTLCQLDKGIENVNAEEMGAAVDMIKDLAEAEYKATIVKAMEETEEEDRHWYDDYRYKTSGRFAPKGRGEYHGRRGYEEYPQWHMTPEMYRDMDKDYGRMYYTEPMAQDIGRYDTAKRHYTEIRDSHKDNTREDKEQKMKALDEYIKELAGDITSMIDDMIPEERAMVKSKLSTLISKM